MDKCRIPKCRNIANMTYYYKRICDRCFAKYSGDKLKELLKIRQKA